MFGDFDVIGELHNGDVVNLFVLMNNVKLTSSGHWVDRLPICMNG